MGSEPAPFVAISRFEVANDLDDQVHEAFLNRPHLVDKEDGFLRMEILRGIANRKQFWLLTYWRDEDSYRTWHRSHKYSDSHAGIPKGLKLVRGSVEIQRLQRIAQ